MIRLHWQSKGYVPLLYLSDGDSVDLLDVVSKESSIKRGRKGTLNFFFVFFFSQACKRGSRVRLAGKMAEEGSVIIFTVKKYLSLINY